MFKKIIVAIDGSEHSETALHISCNLAKCYDGSIHLVHAPHLETVAYALGVGYVEVGPTQEQIESAGKKVMEDATAVVKKAGAELGSSTLKFGDPKAVILEVVDGVGADLVVMGRRGLGSVGSLVLGSTSLRVAHDAPCAVLTVK